MKQVIQSYKTGQVTLEEVPIPLCKPGGVLVKNVCSLISPGTEKLMIEIGKKSLLGKAMARPDLVRLAWEKAKREGFVSVLKEALNRLDEPIPLGYSSSGIVVEVGEGVKEFQVGERVACAGAGFASHAEYVWVPENLCVPIPIRKVNGYSLFVYGEGSQITNNKSTDDYVSFEEASFAMLGAIALHGIRCGELTPGEIVAVIGLGLIGLLSVQILEAYGFQVVATDIDERKCQIARNISPHIIAERNELKFKGIIEQLTRGSGVDAVIVASASEDNKPLLLSEEICRRRGKIVLIGVADISLTRKVMWEKEISFVVSRASGPGSLDSAYEEKGLRYPLEYVRWTEKRNLEEFLRLIGQSRLDVKRLITHRFKIDEALHAYELILKGKEPYLGILLEYGEKPESQNKIEEIKKENWVALSSTPPSKNVGLIGGGLFTKNILLPKIKKIKGIQLIKVATTSGPTANHIAKKFGFASTTTDYKKILEDENIGSVIITTPHNLHGRMVLETLGAGKNVFVEKPLCINEKELSEIANLYNQINQINQINQTDQRDQTDQRNQFLMVGFNRVFSSLTEELIQFLKGRNTPLVMHYRVNAGYLPADHWTMDKEIGGGRIIGEVCHFIDYLHYLAGAKPVSVFTQSIEGSPGKFFKEDNVSITLKFADGSIGNIIYTAKGSKSFSRERVEVFSEEEVGIIEDFRKLTLVRRGRKKRIKRLSQDMGYEKEMEYFFRENSFDPKLFNRYYYSMLATFKAVESLYEGKPVTVS